MTAPTLRAQHRAARILNLDGPRRRRLRELHDEACRTLRQACIAAQPDPAGIAVEIIIPGYRVMLEADWSLSVCPTATPVPHEWTQTTMAELLADEDEREGTRL